jgi:sporulation protein YlmC with PRC-barrel domain
MKLWQAILFLPLLGTSVSYAAIGTVTEQVNTPPSIQRANKTLSGAKGTGVEMNDAIKTQAGKVGITFEDDTRVQVNENSKLVIDDFVYDPKSKAGKLGAKIALGTVRYASGQIAKNSPQNVALNTPTATISVRGTDFTASVDELGQSTIILLPSCPTDRKTRTVKDIEVNCKTGEISVETDAGIVILNQPFQATKVQSRNQMPSKPVVLNLSENAIETLLVSPPEEMKKDKEDDRKKMRGALDVDFLKEQGLTNALDDSAKQFFQDKLSRNFLDSNFLANMFDMVGNGLDAKFLEEVDTMLPDYKKTSGIIVTKDDPSVTLCRDSGADIQCVTTPQTQNSTLYMTQNNVEFKNRINQGGNTTITLTQK